MASAPEAVPSPRPAYLRRLTVTERLLPWIHASALFALLVPRLILYLPTLSEIVARRNLVKNVHIWVAVAWAIALVAVAVVGNRRALRDSWREIETIDGEDRRWLLHRRP